MCCLRRAGGGYVQQEVDSAEQGPWAALGWANACSARRWRHVTSDEIYSAILERRPYAVRGMAGFYANLVPSGARRWRCGARALAALDFYVHADLFMNPTGELADVVPPVASVLEREAPKTGFEVSARRRHRAVAPVRVEPRGPVRHGDRDELARRLGRHFWDYRRGVPRATGCRALRWRRCGEPWAGGPPQTRHRKIRRGEDGAARALPRRPARSVRIPRRCWQTAIRRCRSMTSRWSARAHGLTWPSATC